MVSIQKIEPILRQNIVVLTESFMSLTGNQNIYALSRRVYGEADFLLLIKQEKRGVTIRKYDDVIAAFVRIWPENTIFPTLVDPQHIKGIKPNGTETTPIRTRKKSPKVDLEKEGGKPRPKARHAG